MAGLNRQLYEIAVNEQKSVQPGMGWTPPFTDYDSGLAASSRDAC